MPAIQRADVIEWDRRNWSLALHYWTANSRIPIQQSRSLEVGAWNGGLSLWMAAQGSRVVCSDLTGPTAKAKELHARYGLTPRITHESIDVTDIGRPGEFDIVLFKSVLGGVGRDGREDRQRQAIGEMYRCLRPGGELWFAENLVGSPLHRYFRRAFVRWGESWRYVTIREMLEWLSAYSEVRYKTVGVLGALGRNESQRLFLGTIDRAILNHVVPRAWRYVIIGVARK